MFGLMPWRKERKMAGTLVPEARPFQMMRRELDSLFDRFFGGWPLDLAEVDVSVGWGLTMEELDKEVVVKAEAPGFEAGDFEVLLTPEMLTIVAAHKEKEEKGKEERVEKRVEFKRSLTVPAGIDPTKVEASYRNGVLEVHLPRTPEAKGRRIEVKA